MLKPIKRVALQASRTLSLQRAWRDSGWRRGRLAILCYHGVALEDEHEWDPNFYMDAACLEGRFQMLMEGGYNVLPLGEAVRRLYEGALPPRSVAITFDDGSYDFCVKALPLLKKYGLPATVYLTTYYCYYQYPVFPIFCGYLLWKARDTFRGRELLGLPLPTGVDLHIKAGRERVVRQIAAHAEEQGLSREERERLVEELARQLALDYTALRAKRILQLMRPEEVTRIARGGVDIQLHTHRHRTPLDRDYFIREIAENRRCIQEMTGAEAVHFCYPGGDFQEAFVPWLREQGVATATTCKSGLASPHSHPLLLPRLVDHCGLAPIEFESALVGISAALVQR